MDPVSKTAILQFPPGAATDNPSGDLNKLAQTVVPKSPRRRLVTFVAEVHDTTGALVRIPAASVGNPIPYALLAFTQAGVTGINYSAYELAPDLPTQWIVPPNAEVWAAARDPLAGAGSIHLSVCVVADEGDAALVEALENIVRLLSP